MELENWRIGPVSRQSSHRLHSLRSINATSSSLLEFMQPTQLIKKFGRSDQCQLAAFPGLCPTSFLPPGRKVPRALLLSASAADWNLTSSQVAAMNATKSSMTQVHTHKFPLAKFSQARVRAPASANAFGGVATGGKAPTEEITWTHFSRPSLTCSVSVHASETMATAGHKMLNAHAKVDFQVEWRLEEPTETQDDLAYSQPASQQSSREQRSIVLVRR